VQVDDNRELECEASHDEPEGQDGAEKEDKGAPDEKRDGKEDAEEAPKGPEEGSEEPKEAPINEDTEERFEERQFATPEVGLNLATLICWHGCRSCDKCSTSHL
jgi:midasin